MKFTTILVFLIAALLLAGCEGSTTTKPATDAWVNDIASPETTTKDITPDPCDINVTFANGQTKPLKSIINGVNKWTCNIDHECKLVLVTLNAGKYCAVNCPKGFTVKVPDQAKLVSDTELAYQIPNFEPQSCILVTN